MSVPTTGQLEKLTIIAFTDAALTKEKPNGSFVVMFNPNTFSVNHTNSYDQFPQAGKGVSDQKQDKRNPRTLSMELFFDGTNVSPSVGKSKKASAHEVTDADGKGIVDASVESFLKIAYDIDSTEHRTSFLVFVWGNFFFAGVLESANVTYSLFAQNGKSLRAKISISVKEHITDKKLNAELNLQSPDLTQSRTVISGDTLPNLAEKIYRDESLYLELARVNNLHNYRKLVPGQKLIFPPIEKIKGKA